MPTTTDCCACMLTMHIHHSPTVHLLFRLGMLSTVSHGPVLVHTRGGAYRRGWVDVPSLVGVIIHHSYAPRQWESLGVISAIKR